MADGKQKYSGVLEKKWTSVIRLQKKVLDLEKQTQVLQEEIASAPVRKATSSVDWIPRPPERFSLTGHRGVVTGVSFHPVFSVIATSSEDATVKIWDYETGDFERTLKGHTNAVQDVAFDPSGRYAASCSADMSVKLWDTQDEYKCVKTLQGHDHNVSGVAFISAQHLVSCSRDNTIRVWQIATGYCIRTLKGHTDWVRHVAVNENGTLIASCSSDQSVRVWDPMSDAGDAKMELYGHEHVVECVAWAPRSANGAIRELLGLPQVKESAPTTGKEGGKESGKESGQQGQQDGPPGTYLVSGSRDRTMRLWDTITGQCVHTFSGHDNWVRGVAWHPSGKFLLSVSDDKTMRIWEVKSGRNVKTYDAHAHFCTAIAFNGKSPVVATGSVDQTAKIWECR